MNPAGPTARAAPVWAARTGTGLDPGFAAYAQTVEDDAPFVAFDAQGSVAHALGLHAVGLLTAAEAAALVGGLQRLAAEHAAGTWRLDAALEDVHMNLESRLTDLCGEAGKKVHTGRSRNDQVAACLVLHARHHLAGLARRLHGLAVALAAQAQTHAATPWTARTHGQPAQPATLGFLLAAHAWRVHDALRGVLTAFDDVGESPLGAGAVAGSTLPLRPDVVAAHLGLRPPRNAILAAGARDASLAACRAAAATGHVLASLAQDLMDLYTEGALRLPEGFTSGSSLMPHKRNPDALELARGTAKALAGPLAAVEAVTRGLGLGYVRDLQVVKPQQHRALLDAAATADVLAACVQGARFDARRLTEGLARPGVAATDAAEALVAAGVPFRDAYRAVAAAHRAAEAYGGVDAGDAADGGAAGAFADALRGAGLPADAVAAALAAGTPDPARRATLGGPAPQRVRESVDALDAALAAAAARVGDADAAVAQAASLLTLPPERLVQEQA